MRRRCNHMRMRHWRRMDSTRDQTREVRHIDKKERPNLIRNRSHPRKIELPRISAAAADNHLGLLEQRKRLKLIVINRLRVLADLVTDHAIELARKIQLVSMRKMPAMSKVQPKNAISRRKQCHARRRIGLRTGVRLHVRMF